MPSKHLKIENALVGIGADVLKLLDREKLVSTLFRDFQKLRCENQRPTLHFDWFLLSLDFLFIVGAIRFEGGLLRKVNQ